MDGTFHKNAKKELKSHQMSLVDAFINGFYSEEDIREAIEKYPAWQIGKKQILDSDYIKIALRKKKLKQIQNNLIK